MNESQAPSHDDQLFLTLVADLVTQAWIALGKWKNPVTDKMERNVPVAGILIDMLDMLYRKTAGNRSEAEDRYLLDSLQQLKLNYVSERDKAEEPEEDKSAADESVTESEPTQETETTVKSESATSTAKSAKSTTAKKSPQKKSTSKPRKKTSSKSSS
jgi:hypothetical protein